MLFRSSQAGKVKITLAAPVPERPVGLTTTAADSSVSLVWDATPSATSYSVLRSTIAGADLQLESKSIGAAFQVGADYKLQNNWFLNVDLKKIYIDTDIKVNGNKSSHLNLDPLALSIGIGKRF